VCTSPGLSQTQDNLSGTGVLSTQLLNKTGASKSARKVANEGQRPNCDSGNSSVMQNNL
jgi:hypothetical protein